MVVTLIPNSPGIHHSEKFEELFCTYSPLLWFKTPFKTLIFLGAYIGSILEGEDASKQTHI